MNKYEQRTQESKRKALQSTGLLWTLGIALLFITLALTGVRFSAPTNYYSRLALFGAIALLVLRQVNRRLGKKRSRAAEPDPQSRLNLD